MSNASEYLFVCQKGSIRPYDSGKKPQFLLNQANLIHNSMKSLLSDKKYPCIAAQASLAHNDYQFGVYEGFGLGNSSFDLSKDLKVFMEDQKHTKAPFHSFWAVYPEEEMTETEFEERLWSELSSIARIEEFQTRWDPHFNSDPREKKFCFSFLGSAFFVVGLHLHSSRKARRFPYPTLVFNLYEQFTALMGDRKYDRMVKVNRERELEYQGSLNPMVLKYGNEWESIQFSGANNPSDWKCPFKTPNQSDSTVGLSN